MEGDRSLSVTGECEHVLAERGALVASGNQVAVWLAYQREGHTVVGADRGRYLAAAAESLVETAVRVVAGEGEHERDVVEACARGDQLAVRLDHECVGLCVISVCR